MGDNRETTGKVGKNKPPLHTRFKPGETGNPAGRPEGTKNRSTILKKWLEVASKVKDIETGTEIAGTIEDKVAIGLLKKAIEGDVQAAREVFDSVYGKPTQPVHATGTLTIQAVYKEQYGNDPLPE